MLSIYLSADCLRIVCTSYHTQRMDFQLSLMSIYIDPTTFWFPWYEYSYVGMQWSEWLWVRVPSAAILTILAFKFIWLILIQHVPNNIQICYNDLSMTSENSKSNNYVGHCLTLITFYMLTNSMSKVLQYPLILIWQWWNMFRKNKKSSYVKIHPICWALLIPPTCRPPSIYPICKPPVIHLKCRQLLIHLKCRQLLIHLKYRPLLSNLNCRPPLMHHI